MAKPGKILVAYIHPGTVEEPFCKSMIGLAKNQLFGGAISALGKRPDLSRNQLINEFLDTGMDWLLFVDSDLIFGSNVLDRLLATAHPKRRPVVSGLTFAQNLQGRIYPAFFPHYDPKVGFIADPYFDYPRDRPFEVEAFGGGCVLFHRSVFLRVQELFFPETPMPWWQTGPVVGDRVVGYAQVFSHRVRQAGYKIFVEPRAKFGHINKVVYTEEMYLAVKESRST